MLCEQILGTLSDEQFKNLKVDYVDIEWHEAFKKLHAIQYLHNPRFYF